MKHGASNTTVFQNLRSMPDDLIQSVAAIISLNVQAYMKYLRDKSG